MKMHCLRLQRLTNTEQILHKQEYMPGEIQVYISDSGIRSHYRAFQRFCPSFLCNGKVSNAGSV